MDAEVRTSHTPLDLSKIEPAAQRSFGLDRLPLQRPGTSLADLMSLTGKVALVTGAGGDGLGNAIGHRLAELGASVAVLDVNEEVGEAAAEDIAKRWGVRTLAVTANVGDRTQVNAAVGEVVTQLGGIDILVNNAGGSGAISLNGAKLSPLSKFVDNDDDYVDTVVLVNLLGVMNVTKATLKHMLPRNNGRIVNIASEGGKTGIAGLAVYNSCKSAVIGFTRNLATETGPEGVSVVAVCPGILVNQRMLDAPVWTPESPIGTQYERVSVGRVGMPDDAATTVAFLASPAGEYVHGTAVSVGGGMTD